jgi:hypothetical protein
MTNDQLALACTNLLGISSREAVLIVCLAYTVFMTYGYFHYCFPRAFCILVSMPGTSSILLWFKNVHIYTLMHGGLLDDICDEQVLITNQVLELVAITDTRANPISVFRLQANISTESYKLHIKRDTHVASCT